MCSSARAVSRHESEEAPGLDKIANRISGENVPSNILLFIFVAAPFMFFWKGFTAQSRLEGGKKLKSAAYKF